MYHANLANIFRLVLICIMRTWHIYFGMQGICHANLANIFRLVLICIMRTWQIYLGSCLYVSCEIGKYISKRNDTCHANLTSLNVSFESGQDGTWVTSF